MAMLKAENIQKSFGRIEVLKNISFSLEKGEVLAMRCGGKFYVVQFVTNVEGEAENRRMYDAVLQSIELPA